MNQKNFLLCVCIFILTFFLCANLFSFNFDRYHTPSEINKALKDFVASNQNIARLHRIAKSPGGRIVYLIEIGSEISKGKKTMPAVLVVANMEGTVPISSEAAIYITQMILKKPEYRKDKTWYILPVGNPDAASKYFKKPLAKDSRNDRPHNDDMDDQVDEDGSDDLDGNGIITMMRVKDPEGIWIPVKGEPRLMKKADWSKGEKGIYKLYIEGVDNDLDGKYNEDGRGGVNIGVNFPHLFKFHTKAGGLWSGSEDESFNLIKFIFEHKEIAITFTFGETNFCKTPPRGGRKGTVDLTKIKIPKRFGRWFNIDTERTYTMKEVIEIVKGIFPSGMEVTEAMIARFLGLGAVVNPLQTDLKFYKELSEKYKDFLKKNKLDAKRLETPRAKDGSFELWSYYHLGLPSFSMDFWTLPELKKKKKKGVDITPEKLEKMSNEEFIALGKEKISEFLKSSGAPKRFKADMIIQSLKGGMITTKRMAQMLKRMPKPKGKEGGDPKKKALLAFSDKELGGKGFVQWKPFKHPTLGDIEIGGEVPYVSNTPPPKMIEKLLKGQVPWIFNLVKKIARIKIGKTEVKSMGSGLYRINVWVENSGFLPYPTAMGKRNRRLPPIILSLEGKNYKIVEGKNRVSIKSIDGNKTKKVKWMIYAKKPVKINLKLITPIAGNETTTIMLGGKK